MSLILRLRIFFSIQLFIFNALDPLMSLIQVFNLPFKELKACKEFPSYSLWEENGMKMNFNTEMKPKAHI